MATGEIWRYRRHSSIHAKWMRGEAKVKMKIKNVGLALIFFISLQGSAQIPKTSYPGMAPLNST
jgi:hypothetical protein